MSVIAGDIVDWAALGKVVVASLLTGVGMTLFFSFAIIGATRFAEMRRDQRMVGATFYAALGVLGAAVTVAGVVGGIIVMTHKS
jgi:hypothetical protein